MSEITIENKSENKRGWVLPILLVVFIGIVASALFYFDVFSPAVSTEELPESPQALWEAQDVASYRYTIQISCFCPSDLREPVIVEVLNGTTASIAYAGDGTAVTNPEFFERYSSIDKLFTIINETNAQEPARSDITYDEVYGVPVSVSIDISEMMADEEIYWTVTEFEPVQ